jgi:hypothetical protein
MIGIGQMHYNAGIAILYTTHHHALPEFNEVKMK